MRYNTQNIRKLVLFNLRNTVDNYVCNKIGRKIIFTSGNEKVNEWVENNYHHTLKMLLPTILKGTMRVGVLYILKLQDEPVLILNPTFPIRIKKENGVIKEIKGETWDTNEQDGFLSPMKSLDITETYIKVNNKIRYHNLGFCPVVEVLFKNEYSMNSRQVLDNWYQPYKMNSYIDNDWTKFNFSSIFETFYSSCIDIEDSINQSYVNFLIRENFTPKYTLSKSSQGQIRELNKNESNFLDSSIFIVAKGDQTELGTSAPNLYLSEYMSAHRNLVEDYYFHLGLNFPLLGKGNNKTQSEIEDTQDLTSSTINGIRENMESNLEMIVELFLKVDKALGNIKIKGEVKDFKFGLWIDDNKPISTSAIDLCVKAQSLPYQLLTREELRLELGKKNYPWILTKLEQEQKEMEQLTQDSEETPQKANKPQKKGGVDNDK